MFEMFEWIWNVGLYAESENRSDDQEVEKCKRQARERLVRLRVLLPTTQGSVNNRPNER